MAETVYSEEFVTALARQAYEEGRASFPIDVHKTALLVIDMQAEFVEPGLAPSWVPAATRMIPRLAAVLDAARKAGRPVIHTAFANTHLAWTGLPWAVPCPTATRPTRWKATSSKRIFQRNYNRPTTKSSF
jgi:nicotinamidase-related amidase